MRLPQLERRYVITATAQLHDVGMDGRAGSLARAPFTPFTPEAVGLKARNTRRT